MPKAQLTETLSLRKKKSYSFEEPVLFTTGAYIQPLKVVDSMGKETWFWVVSEFVDDTFMDGEPCNPRENGFTIDGLYGAAVLKTE